MTDDGQLLRQYLENRSQVAFAELVDRHLNLVYGAARRRLGGDAHAAADVAQQVFILLARKAWKLCGHPSLVGWLYRTVNYEAAQWIRGGRRRQLREQEYALAQETARADESGAAESLLPGGLDEAILQLDASDREVIVLHYLAGQPFAAIGSRLGLSEAGAQKRAERALEKLRALLRRRGLSSTTATLGAAMAGQAALAAPTGLAPAIASSLAAQAITAGPLTLTLVQIMSTTKLSLGAVGLIALTVLLGTSATGVAFHEFRRERSTREQVAAARASQAAAQIQLTQLQQEEAASARNLSQLETGAVRPGGTKAVRSGSAARAISPHPARTPREEAQLFLTAYPAARQLLAEIGPAQIAAHFAPFLKSSSLSPAQISEFTAAVYETWEGSIMVAPGTIHPTVLLPPEAQLRSILGDQGYEQLRDYDQLLPQYLLSNQLTIASARAGSPLSAEQRDQFVQILAKNSSAAFSVATPESMPAIDWDAVAAQTRGIVTPAQWSAAQATILNMQFGQAYRTAMTPAPTVSAPAK